MDIRERERDEIEAYEKALARMEITDEKLRIPRRIINRYATPCAERRLPVDLLFQILGDLNGASILDCGCGDGEFSTIMGLLGGRVVGIDISSTLIELAERRAHINGMEDRVKFICSSVHDLPFPSENFDIAFGKGVLHHVNIPQSAVEISRVLKTNGRAVFEEPIALSSFFRAIRKSRPMRFLVSEDRITPDEEPLTQDDIDAFASRFSHSKTYETQLLARLERIFKSERVLERLNNFDIALFRICPPLKHFGRQAVLEFIK
jgi:2-polyprenyl-3-methyl-5-hydroxy-6-metoxy-1,4-benzoquinol methylase